MQRMQLSAAVKRRRWRPREPSRTFPSWQPPCEGWDWGYCVPRSDAQAQGLQPLAPPAAGHELLARRELRVCLPNWGHSWCAICSSFRLQQLSNLNTMAPLATAFWGRGGIGKRVVHRRFNAVPGPSSSQVNIPPIYFGIVTHNNHQHALVRRVVGPPSTCLTPFARWVTGVLRARARCRNCGGSLQA